MNYTSEDVNKLVDKLERHWRKGDLDEVAYLISNLSLTAEYRWINDVMAEFKSRLDNI